jgi:dinuclear metal center YbgI/SA1388 family protein
MLANGETIIRMMEQWAPKYLAYPDDKIGLQLGTLNKKVQRVLVALDVTAEVVEEAIAIDANLIIAHHAIIFRPLAHLRTDTAAGKLFETCIKRDVAVYIAHTNLDIAEGGVNDLLADALGLQQSEPLEETYNESLLKLTVFIPHAALERVRAAMFQAGAGFIQGLSKYSHCSFNIDGKGTFLPLDGAQPHIGTVGKMETVEEVRMEVVVGERDLKRVIRAMKDAHPYEEVAYDVVPLRNSGLKMGLGRIGRLKQIMTLESFCEHVKEALKLDYVRVVGGSQRNIQKVAVLGGSGGRFISKAQFAGADVLVTGDIDHHTAHDALAAGMCVIDAGHHIESILKTAVAEKLQHLLGAERYSTEVVASTISTDPFRMV